MRATLLIVCCVLCANAQTKRIPYPAAAYGDYKPIPKFDKGYMFSMEHRCVVTVSGPDGYRMFSRQLEGPNGLPCNLNDMAVDARGSIAAAISFIGPAGFTGAILRLDATGQTKSIMETGRYEPAHIGIDRNQFLWTIGSKRDDVDSMTLDKGEYFLVRKYSQDGKQIGEFLPRSLWGPRADPGGGGRGYWRLAVARDKIGAIIHEGRSDDTPEFIEWDLDGKLLTRTPIGQLDCGRVYTESGRFYAKMWDKESKTFGMYLLDTQAKQWKPTGERHSQGEVGLMLGAEGDELVYRAPSGPDLIWRRPQ